MKSVSLVGLDRTANEAAPCPALISWVLWACVATDANVARIKADASLYGEERILQLYKGSEFLKPKLYFAWVV